MPEKGTKKENRKGPASAVRFDKYVLEVIDQFAKENNVNQSTAIRMLVAHGINYVYNIKGE